MTRPMTLLGLSALTAILSLTLVGWMLKLGATRGSAPSGWTPPSVEEMKTHMLWGLFYVHPGDPRGWVPKTSGLGYTVNFRTERKAKIFACLIVATLFSAVAQIMAAAFGCAST